MLYTSYTSIFPKKTSSRVKFISCRTYRKAGTAKTVICEHMEGSAEGNAGNHGSFLCFHIYKNPYKKLAPIVKHIPSGPARGVCPYPDGVPVGVHGGRGGGVPPLF